MASSSGARRTAAPAPVAGGATPPRVGEQIQRLRNERKLTLDDLSRAAGVSKSMLSEIERDKANPTIAVAWRLTNALGISLDELFAQPKAPETIRVDGPHDIPTLAGHDAQYQLRVWGPIELAGKFEWYELTLPANGAQHRCLMHRPAGLRRREDEFARDAAALTFGEPCAEQRDRERGEMRFACEFWLGRRDRQDG